MARVFSGERWMRNRELRESHKKEELESTMIKQFFITILEKPEDPIVFEQFKDIYENDSIQVVEIRRLPSKMRIGVLRFFLTDFKSQQQLLEAFGQLYDKYEKEILEVIDQ